MKNLATDVVKAFVGFNVWLFGSLVDIQIWNKNGLHCVYISRNETSPEYLGISKYLIIAYTIAVFRFLFWIETPVSYLEKHDKDLLNIKETEK